MRNRGLWLRRATAAAGLLTLLLFPATSLAMSVIPISDAELYGRADVVVHGIVVSSHVAADGFDRPETVSVIEPLAVLKGRLRGNLVLHQLGGTLPDGRFLKLWGRPEYTAGREVIVFAIACPEGGYQTAEMLLGKFEVWEDETGARFAVPDLAIGVHPGVDVHSPAELFPHSLSNGKIAPRSREAALGESTLAGQAASPNRELGRFLASIRAGGRVASAGPAPSGALHPVGQPADRNLPVRKRPLWGNINNQFYRWNNNATAAFALLGTANITGGGTAEATAALAAWTNDPNSSINYTVGSSVSNTIDLNAATSSCGWTTCLATAGVIGCGGPTGGGSNTFRGDSYSTIGSGFVQLRCLATPNLFPSASIQAVLEHELGHTLGLGHSDQNVSPHDTCRGDEDAAIMRSVAQNSPSFGTDDQDAIRWLYGDGLNSCTAAPSPTVSTISPPLGSVSGGTAVTISGANLTGATVTVGGVAATGVTVVNSTTITATTPAGSAGPANVVVTNPSTQSGTLNGGFTYVGSPTITLINPATGSTNGGRAVTITGTNLTGATSVTFGGTAAVITGSSSTQVNVTTPGHALGSVNVSFSGQWGSTTATNGYTFIVPNRVFASARSGNDANDCSSIVTPCQTFAGAVAYVVPGGEVIVLDSGGYGPVTITKSVTIEAPAGVLAFIHPPSGDGVTISAGPNDAVVLRGLTLNGGVANGITVNTVGGLYVENCVVNGFLTGISMLSPGLLFMKDTIVRGCSVDGVHIAVASGTAAASIDRCRFESNGTGLDAGNGARVSIRRSVASGNGSGLAASATAAGSAELNVARCLVSNNGVVGVNGAGAGGGIGTVRVSRSTVTNNGTGLQQSGSGALLSRSNNTVEGNGVNTTGTVGVYSVK